MKRKANKSGRKCYGFKGASAVFLTPAPLQHWARRSTLMRFPLETLSIFFRT